MQVQIRSGKQELTVEPNCVYQTQGWECAQPSVLLTATHEGMPPSPPPITKREERLSGLPIQ